MTLPARVQTWLDSPDGGALFTRQRDDIRAHDPTCTSLTGVWLPRRTGRTSSVSLTDCEDCHLTFRDEGLGMYNTDIEFDILLCMCCARQRGLP